MELTKISRDLVQTIEKEELRTYPINLDHYLVDQIEKKKTVFGNAAFTIEDEIPDINVKANEMISSIFRNILSNVIKNNDKETPKIDISIEEKQDTVTVVIADNGSGIPDDMKDKVFGRGEKGLESEGTGIGLYLVKTLIDEFGGEVWIEDNKPE